jgi:hypothetical protein
LKTGKFSGKVGKISEKLKIRVPPYHFLGWNFRVGKIALIRKHTSRGVDWLHSHSI